MTKDELSQLVTAGDLQQFYLKLTGEIREMIFQNNIKEFYTPMEFSKLTGMPYSTVIHYLNTGQFAARQGKQRGSWLIYRSEVDKLILEAKNHVQ